MSRGSNFESEEMKSEETKPAAQRKYMGNSIENYNKPDRAN